MNLDKITKQELLNCLIFFYRFFSFDDIQAEFDYSQNNIYKEIIKIYKEIDWKLDLEKEYQDSKWFKLFY